MLLEVDQLTKHYGDVAALTDLRLSLDRGGCVALVGHNGSGKSTAIGCVAGRLRPTSGRVLVEGTDIVTTRDPVAARRVMSVIPDTAAFYPDLTVREHLEVVALAHGLGRDTDDAVAAVLDDLGLTERAGQLPQQLSAGLRQKAQLACGLVRPFDLLVLDEPAQYLDVDATAWLLARLRQARDEGVGILLSSHDPAFVRELADEVIVLTDGRATTPDPRA
ncbi:MAG TPA: ABC transporter ATP-binding protein [Egicoccus sp.]|nr:ABC transporter ATP-binding protein [Egicoccus sp.]HSK24641.1 ABC transporter ATP-binding protein [Egicoccus sp.]